jgi:hypothetical protein
MTDGVVGAARTERALRTLDDEVARMGDPVPRMFWFRDLDNLHRCPAELALPQHRGARSRKNCRSAIAARCVIREYERVTSSRADPAH